MSSTKSKKTKKAKPVKKAVKKVEPVRKDYCVRTKETGDKVYLIKDKTRHWIKNPETLKALGFWFGDEKTITYKELIAFDEGKPIDKKAKTPKEKTPTSQSKAKTSKQTETNVSRVKPVLGYKESATLEDFEKYNE